MLTKKWATGAEILKRWKALDFELLAAFKNGLCPYGTQDGVKLTRECPCYQRRNTITGKRQPKETSDILRQLKVDMFKVAEVLEYERLHGMVIEPQSPPTAAPDTSQVADTPQAEAKAGGAVKGTRQGGTKRCPITQEVAALLCGVTTRQLQKWEKGIETPAGFPGRHDIAFLKAWANTYHQRKFLSKEARAMNHASPVDPQIIAAMRDEDNGHVFD
ncbi:MAG: hypothetical protein KKA55_06835 [Proteobacteria bacterium]|nr:hypothetical protein [Pseudomonadota bacterium]MBU1595233.1 hypothetical protein [Pseudomonadota bacterium]